MAGDDLDIIWQIFLECRKFWRLARSLATYNGTYLGRRTILGHNAADNFSLDAVDDPVTNPRNEVSIRQNSDPFLSSSMMLEEVPPDEPRSQSLFSRTRICWVGRTHIFWPTPVLATVVVDLTVT